MSQFDARRFTLWRPMWWQLTLLAALAIAVVLAFAIVATSLALIIAPIALMAVFAHRFFGRRPAPRSNAHSSQTHKVIDAEYEIVSVRPARTGPVRRDDTDGG